MWGQGLQDDNKFYSLACFTLGQQQFPGLQAEMRAHSGAVIGVGVDGPWPTLPGEVPASGPTVLNQCAAYDGDPGSVRVVLMDGGINDIDVKVILNPTTNPADLSDLIKQHCYEDMKTLLQAVADKFSDNQCRIILLGYYPILGSDSDETGIPWLLKARGIPDVDALLLSAAAISDPRALAVQFWKESDRWLRQAAADVNPGAGNRITYILPPFTEENALFKSDPWLWSVALDLAAEDEVVAQRTDACIRLVPDELECQICRRASVGHPNATGSLKYYEAIMTAFQ